MDNDIYVMTEDGEIHNFGPRDNGWVITGALGGVAVGADGREKLIREYKRKLELRLRAFKAEYD